MNEFNFETKGMVKSVVIYDSTSDKRRTKISKVLESYGKRVQKSAFESALPYRKFRKMLCDIERAIAKEDSVRIYIIDDESKFYTWDSNGFTNSCDVMIC